ncbi:restriction endonuclease subunit S [Halomonas sp.]|uniref:restriction endonuclease subunit S n=1 Tax=Halomonas sp. TaxID=1486246 RepID=UPI003A8E0697
MSNRVPEGWEETKLGHVASLTMGQSPSSDTYNTEAVGLPFFQGKADFGSRSPKVRYWCSKPTKVADEGSILFSVRAPVGEVNITPAACCIGRGLSGIKAASADQEFLYQKLQYVKPLFALLSQGSTFEAVNGGEMKEFPLTLPPLPEQKKIAAILSSVDEVIEKTRAQIDKLKDLKTGMMQELLTKGIGLGGIPHTEFKDSPVGRIPLSWGVVPLINAVSKIVDCEHKTAPYVDSSEYLVVRTSNVRSGQLIQEDMKFTTKDGFAQWTQRALPTEGDVLFTREAPAGESCMVPTGLKVCMGQRMVLLRPNTENIYPYFFSLFLISEAAQQAIYELSIGTTVSRINIEDIKRIPCLVPPLEEQVEIYNSVQAVQSLITVKEQMLESTKSSKKALMQDLLTGKVRVNVEARELADA